MELWDFFSTGSAFRTAFALGLIALARMGRFYYTAVIWPLIVRRLRRKSYNPLATFLSCLKTALRMLYVKSLGYSP